MTFREAYIAYEKSLTDDNKRKWLNDLRTVLDQADLLDLNISESKNAGDIRKALRPQIMWYSFDIRDAIISIVNDFFSSESFGVRDSEKIWQKISKDGRTDNRFLKVQDLYDTTELRIKFLKYLQSGEDVSKRLTMPDLEEAFSMSHSAIEGHIKALTDECSILGTNVKITRHKSNFTYDSTIHPIFLALNLSEVYFLMVTLRDLIEKANLPPLIKDNYKEHLSNITSDIERQLSPYAKKKLFGSSSIEDSKYKSSESSEYRTEGLDWLYHEKTGRHIPCEIDYHADDGDKKLKGKVYRRGPSFYLETATETIKLDMDKILNITILSEQ